MRLAIERYALIAISIFGLTGFMWPLVFPILFSTDADVSGVMSLILVPVFLLAGLWLAQGKIAGPRQIALLGVLASLAAATRIATSGVGGFELIFVIVILGGAATSPRFGFLLGALSVLISSLFFGGIGPWTAFQMFGLGWVGAGAGLFAKRLPGSIRPWQIALYAIFASYLFGLLMNFWFWPFAVGPQTWISYDQTASFGQNLTSFLTYSLLTSTLSWDTVRAISTTVVILLVAKPFIATLRRYRF